MSPRTTHATSAPNWSCFRRMGDEREALAYGGGWEVLRGGSAKCIICVRGNDRQFDRIGASLGQMPKVFGALVSKFL